MDFGFLDPETKFLAISCPETNFFGENLPRKPDLGWNSAPETEIWQEILKTPENQGGGGGEYFAPNCQKVAQGGPKSLN